MTKSRVQLLNLQLDSITKEELLSQFDQGLLVTPNVDHLIKLQKDSEFYRAYQSAEYCVCDSRILLILSRILFPKESIREQITGSDFFPSFCRYHANTESNVKIFLLGGTDASVLQAQQNINERTHSSIVVGGYSPPFGFEKDEKENSKILRLINESGADTLAVGVGAPKQELWIYNNRHKLKDIRRYMAIGATIEFESGHLKRAPKWMTKIGMEWAFRLALEPKRLFKRYILQDLPIFLLLIKQKTGHYRNPWGDSR